METATPHLSACPIPALTAPRSAQAWRAAAWTLVCVLTCAPGLLAQGIVAWGDNSSGQANVPALPTTSSVSSVEIGAGDSDTLSRSGDGTLLGWGVPTPTGSSTSRPYRPG